MPPPQPPGKYDKFLSGGEGVVHPPLPQIPCKQIFFKELSRLCLAQVNQSTEKKKQNKYD